ncbi:MAG: hypothetical protein Q8N44_18330 [Rubrivivax sp.]|nr:hypothetical protein [Rubrivivax sp.]MDP3085631.1 hypothetical protein [Rubrivivax sp.]
MRKVILGFIAAVLTSSACLAADLTATEKRWLKGLWPVVEFAWQSQLPLDIVVQPQPTPGAAPLALAFVGGRCKLVLSMRGHRRAQDTLDAIAPDLVDATLELMGAHELGHCRRYLDGAWYQLPAGFSASVPADLSTAMRAAYAGMKAARREEGYGDLVGLAWIQQRHPQHYARLHAWLVAERSAELVHGSHHDTLLWVRLAQHGADLAHASIFARAGDLWAAGVAVDE